MTMNKGGETVLLLCWASNMFDSTVDYSNDKCFL